ncbi:unnamed protein product [Parnassius apollo]|uniref:(apollo) hypothetical protein n=1 Tax=Parnassius apollo TaxID=110799 RepID=A0A8S3W3D5_PARAO|nr:unnamed protein product [Parnassius apollo]
MPFIMPLRITFRVTSGQLEILLSKLEASPHLYTRKFSGLQGKEIFEKGWREVADELNQLPNGSVKTPEQWITVWRDFRSQACTKAAKLRRERMRTGNQGITTAPLTEVEKKIVSLIGVEYTFGSDCPDSMPEEETLQHEVEAGVEMVEVLLETERDKASPAPQIIASGSRATPVASPAPNQQQVQEITLQSAAPQITERGSRAAAVITTPPTVQQERPRRIRTKLEFQLRIQTEPKRNFYYLWPTSCVIITSLFSGAYATSFLVNLLQLCWWKLNRKECFLHAFMALLTALNLFLVMALLATMIHYLIPMTMFRFRACATKHVKKPIIILPSDSDTSDDEIVDPRPKNLKQKRAVKEKIIWTEGKMPAYDENNFNFSEDLITFITEQSNLKSTQVNVNKPANITTTEIEQFIGIVIFTSLVHLPSTRMYWSNNIGQHQVNSIMTCNKFEMIKRHLHFNNNEDFKPPGTQSHDKLFKIRPLIEKLRERLLLISKEEYLAVDEQIIPTKARHQLKQYNPAKPHKWGYKNQVLSGVSGFSYDFDIFAGDQSNIFPSDAPDLGVSSNVVTRLTSTVPRNVNHKIFFDNWFNSIKLQVYLYKNGLLPLGTIRMNRVPNADMPTEKDLKKIGRGTMVEKIAIVDDVKLSLVSWYDNKVVNLLSAFVGSEPTSTKTRYFRKDKQYKDITSPQCVDVYNRHMGGIDLLDSLLGLYRIKIRSRQWYKKIFFHLVDMCAVNAWLLWRPKTDQYMSLFDFKLAISEHYCKAGKSISRKRGRPSISNPGTPTLSRGNTPTSFRTDLNPLRSTAEQANIAREDFLAVAKSNADSMRVCYPLMGCE